MCAPHSVAIVLRLFQFPCCERKLRRGFLPLRVLFTCECSQLCNRFCCVCACLCCEFRRGSLSPVCGCLRRLVFLAVRGVYGVCFRVCVSASSSVPESSLHLLRFGRVCGSYVVARVVSVRLFCLCGSCCVSSVSTTWLRFSSVSARCLCVYVFVIGFERSEGSIPASAGLLCAETRFAFVSCLIGIFYSQSLLFVFCFLHLLALMVFWI